jgi:hypothetical protein
VTRVTRHDVTREDVTHIVRHLRERDRREIFALRWDDSEDTFIDQVCAVAGAMWQVWRLDDVPVAINGVVPARPGVVLAGAFGTDQWKHALRAITHHAYAFVIPALQLAQYHRAEAYVLAANAESAHWIEMLGGQREAYLHQYGRNCEDFILYTWRLNDVLRWRRRRLVGAADAALPGSRRGSYLGGSGPPAGGDRPGYHH